MRLVFHLRALKFTAIEYLNTLHLKHQNIVFHMNTLAGKEYKGHLVDSAGVEASDLSLFCEF